MSENVAFRVHSDVFINRLTMQRNMSLARTPTEEPPTEEPPTEEPPVEPQNSVDSLFSLMEMVQALDDLPVVGVRFQQRNSTRIITRQVFNSILRDSVDESLQTSRQLRRNDQTKIIVDSQKYNSLISGGEYSNECSICVEEFKPNDDVTVLDCKHLFHNKCILEWGHYNTVCPICREKIPSIPEEDEDDDDDEIEME